MIVINLKKKQTTVSCAIYCNPFAITNLDIRHENHKIWWEDDRLPFDHAPFILANHRVYDCQHGVDRHLSEKEKCTPPSKISQISQLNII